MLRTFDEAYCSLHHQILIYEGMKAFQPDIQPKQSIGSPWPNSPPPFPPPPHQTTHPDRPQDKSYEVISGARLSQLPISYRDLPETGPCSRTSTGGTGKKRMNRGEQEWHRNVAGIIGYNPGHSGIIPFHCGSFWCYLGSFDATQCQYVHSGIHSIFVISNRQRG